ncbi:uncharacterized protein LOC107027546 [Solanum pennellii]|uniref:Uncharacterized protein LOC107027546 n=1 Tax=Solanum pennellii TaxID=28526 RepID=A0ABM1HE36_SOLPN|nr:uncharacterized protein LOC107027546 [Solanum pennellii]
MESIWNHITLSEPVLRNSDVAGKSLVYNNNDKLNHFLMALTNDYETTRAALLNQQPLTTLEDALPQLKSEETRLVPSGGPVHESSTISNSHDQSPIDSSTLDINVYLESTPLQPNVCFSPSDGKLFSNANLYRTVVGSLIYLIVRRPDIAYDVQLVSQLLVAPRSTHYVVLRILRYVKSIMFHGLHLSANSSLELKAYADVDWGHDPIDRLSTSGYYISLGDSLIS